MTQGDKGTSNSSLFKTAAVAKPDVSKDEDGKTKVLSGIGTIDNLEKVNGVDDSVKVTDGEAHPGSATDPKVTPNVVATIQDSEINSSAEAARVIQQQEPKSMNVVGVDVVQIENNDPGLKGDTKAIAVLSDETNTSSAFIESQRTLNQPSFESEGLNLGKVKENVKTLDEIKAGLKTYTYKRDDVREWIVGGFHFSNHVLVIEGDEANDRFLRLVAQLPSNDQHQIQEYYPEVLKEISKPNSVVRGISGSGQIPDQRTTYNPSPLNNM